MAEEQTAVDDVAAQAPTKQVIVRPSGCEVMQLPNGETMVDFGLPWGETMVDFGLPWGETIAVMLLSRATRPSSAGDRRSS